MLKLFITKWSTPCKEFLANIKGLEEFKGVKVIDIDEMPDEGRECGIKGVPTLLNDSTGRMIVGAVSVEQAKQIL